MSYKELLNPGFTSALMKMDRCDQYKSEKVAWNIMRTVKLIQPKIAAAEKERAAFFEKHAKPDLEKGGFSVKRDAHGMPSLDWKEEFSREEVEKNLDAIAEKEVVFDRHKVDLKDLANVGLSPAELGAIENMVLTLEAAP